MAGNFANQVRAFADKARRRQTGIFRASVQALSEMASVPRAQGGNMPVDTGYLRNSLAASASGMPATGAAPPQVVLLSLQAGATIYVGWTANYAIYMEYRYGFARLAAQNWDSIVARVTQEAWTRFP